MKKPTPFEWAKINKQIHSLSDVITAGYIHLTHQDDDEDFGTADLSGYKDDTHFVDALAYSMQGFPKLDNSWHKEVLERKLATPKGSRIEPTQKVCTCGAHKTYGKSAGLSAHSSWCDLKN